METQNDALTSFIKGELTPLEGKGNRRLLAFRGASQKRVGIAMESGLEGGRI